MRFRRNPMFRKIIFPWYESEITCLVVIGFLTAVMAFGAAGISVARDYTPYHRYMWMPLVLVIMSAVVLLACVVRLIIRYTARNPR